MKGKIHLLVAYLVAFCVFSAKCEQEYEEKFVVEEANDQPLFYGDFVDEESPKIYAGPLKPTDEDELIVVSRDNVQQLIKTLMLAYTHSKDPTMMEVLKSGGLGALRTTFKHLGKEDFGESFLATAQMFIDDLDLEKSEEELLGQFAEEYLEKHKFKIVVPESFLLHEKEMVEFLDMKRKMSKKKGRSMPEPETTEVLELNSVLPYTGKQFSTSIIPGIDLTWIALLGGMLAIPYYFWSESETPSTARKDVIEEPLPSLAPPRFNLGPGQNEIKGRKHPKRRRPNNALTPPPLVRQGGLNRFPKIPPGADPKSAYDKQYRNWYNNHYFQQFNQPPPGAAAPPGGRVVMSPIHPGQNPGNFIGHPPPFPHLQTGIPHLNPVGVTHGAPPNHQALIGARVQEIIPHPLQHGGGLRVDGMLPPPGPQSSPRVEIRPGGIAAHGHMLQRQDGAMFPRGHFPVEETGNPVQKQIGVLPQIIPSANRREIIGLHAPEPNSIFEENSDILKQRLPPPPPGPAVVNPSSVDEDRGANPGQFVPTHIEDQTSGHIRTVDGHLARPAHGHHHGVPVLHQRPVPGQAPGPIPGQIQRQVPVQVPGPVPGQVGHPHPLSGVSFPPAQRVRWRAHHPLNQPPRHIPPGVGNPGLFAGRNPSLNHLPLPGIPQAPRVHEAPRLLGGVPSVHGVSRTPAAFETTEESGVPITNQPSIPTSNRPTDRAPASALVTPLLPPPPPPPESQVGSGEDNQSFGAFRHERKGNTHFKVSFEAEDVNKIQGEEDGEKQEEEIANDSQGQESAKSATTFVIVRPPNAVPSEPRKEENILDLSKSQWQKVTQQQTRHQQVLSHTRPLIVATGNKQQIDVQRQENEKEQQQQQPPGWQLQQQERQQQALLEAKQKHEEQQQQEREILIQQQKEREIKEQQEKERHDQQQRWDSERQKQQLLEKQKWEEQQKREQQQKQEAPTAHPLVQHRPRVPQHISQEQYQALLVRQQQQPQYQSQEQPAHQKVSQQFNPEHSSPSSSSRGEPPASVEAPGSPQQPLHIQHFLQQQELRHKEYLKLQQPRLESATPQLGAVSQENEFSVPDKSSNFHAEEQGGFVPIYGPPPPTRALVIRPTTERYVLPKPSAFLDKLKAEQEEATSKLDIVEGERVPIFSSVENENQEQSERPSNLEIALVEPVKLSAENFERAAEEFLADPVNQVEVSTKNSAAIRPPEFTPTQAPPAIFVQKPTSRTGVPLIVTPVRPTKYRVVTSKSVVTSVPVSLSQKYPSAYNLYKTDKGSSTPGSTKAQEVDEVYNDLVEGQTEGVSTGLGQETEKASAVFDSLEELLPNYEQDYRQVLRGYQRKQLGAADQQQLYDQVVEASEQLENYVPPAQSREEVLRQNAAGFVNNNEDESLNSDDDINNNDNSLDVNRRLQTESTSPEVVPADGSLEPGVNRNSKTDANIPIYSLDPFYGPRLSRIDAIFFQMKLDEDQEGCREQVVCNMYKNPDVYTPLSDFLSRQLTVTLEELQKPQVADERILRFFRYLQAARTGQDGGDCLAKYAQCAQDTTRLAHKPILDAFHKVSDLMSHEKI